jgi:type II secretory pathway pseudopilin PulG
MIGKRDGQYYSGLVTLMTRCRLRRLSGVTMVEILVVVGIIAILAQLLAPASIGALDSARMSNCTSNFRQLIVAAKLYEQDYDQLPVHYVADRYGVPGVWQAKTFPYVKNRDVYLCRSDPTGGVAYNWGAWPTSYIYTLTEAWLSSTGAYRPPKPSSPLLLDRFHEGPGGKFLVGRYDGSVKASLRKDLGRNLGYEPEDGLGPYE